MYSLIKKRLTQTITIFQLYLAKNISGKSTINILDIGSSGIKKPLISIPFKFFKIIAFDPDPRMDDLKKNLGNIEFYPFAVAGDNGSRKLYLTKKCHCSSLKKPLKSNDERYFVEKIINVNCKTLDNINEKIDFIKIDAQGAELEILENATNMLKNVSLLNVEGWFTNKYEGQAQIDKVHEVMLKNDFIFIGFSTLYSEMPSKGIKSGLSFGDMIFIKTKHIHKNKKLIISYLLTEYFDNYILKLGLLNKTTFKDKIIILFILLMSKLKDKAPKILFL